MLQPAWTSQQAQQVPTAFPQSFAFIPCCSYFNEMKFSADTLDLAHSSCKDSQGEITTISTRSVLPAVATPSCLLRQACPQAWAAPAWSSFTGISWATWSWSSPRLTRARRTWGRWSTRSYPTARGSGPTSRRRGSREWGRGERRSKWITESCSLQLPLMLQSLTLQSSPANCHSRGCILSVVVVTLS